MQKSPLSDHLEQAVPASSQSRADFLANLSHEMRTPLTAIIGYADLLIGQLERPDDIAFAQVIQRASRCLLEIVSRELGGARMEASEQGRALPDTRSLAGSLSTPLAVPDCIVLLVEDSPVAAEAVRLLLTSLGCTVLVARSGSEALAMVGRGPVDLMLLDLQLPDMTGHELLDAILHLLGDSCSFVVVAHTGHHPSEVGATPGGAFFREVLQKPATSAQLLRLVEAVRSPRI